MTEARERHHSIEQSWRIRTTWGITIPMRDGTKLGAVLYSPEGKSEPGPCIFALTPYTGHRNHARASYFSRHGYAFLIADARGRGNSEGTFRPFIQESPDGCDVVDWIAHQSFCDGRVAMFSGSYEGYVQWATAKDSPPHLRTIVPGMAAAPGREGVPMRNNIFYPYAMRWLTSVAGKTMQERVFDDEEFWKQRYEILYTTGRPFRDLDDVVGNLSVAFQEWVSHPEQDAYWDAYTPTADEYSKIDIPILSLTGAYDTNQAGALFHYRQHVKHATTGAAALHHLVIGPWDHRGTLMPRAEVGGLKFGSEAVVDMMQLHLQWYDWIFRGALKPEFLRNRVSYYVAGLEKWRYASSLEAITAEVRPLYLDSPGSACRVFQSGSLIEIAGTGPGDTYRYDPCDAAFVEGFQGQVGAGTLLRPTFPIDDPTDQTSIYANDGRQLIYHSAQFSEACEISGFFTLTAWISIDQPDTDFVATVYEITADGCSILLTTDVKRARYRQGLRSGMLIANSEPHRYDFDSFTFCSRQVKRGSRLRLVFGPIASVHSQRNFNGGGVVAEETAREARAVKVTIWHDAEHPSALYVPIGEGLSRTPTAERKAEAMSHVKASTFSDRTSISIEKPV